MNAKKAKALRKKLGFKPGDKRTYTKDGKQVISTGLRKQYQEGKKDAKT